VHSQLNSILAKTGCNRQADLMRKIANDPVLKLARHWDAR